MKKKKFWISEQRKLWNYLKEDQKRRVAEVLPKRAYNAVMRDERLFLGDAVASDSIEHEMIIIE